MNNVGPHPAGKGPVAPPLRKPLTKIEAGITDTLAELETENRQLRAENEKLRLAGNELGSVAEELLRLSDREELPFLPTQDLDVCLARWREALR